MVALPEIREAFARYRPNLIERPGLRRAAVAVVLRPADRGPELLFIERARHEGDPWSGHMAFPGGRVDPGDSSLQRAAERETREEVGVSLEGAELLGRLDDLQGRHAGRPGELVISGFVFHHPEPEPLVPNYEVEQTFWFPLAGLRDPARHVVRRFGETGAFDYPGIVVGQPDRHVVWGLTHRFLQLFFEVLGSPLPDPRLLAERGVAAVEPLERS